MWAVGDGGLGGGMFDGYRRLNGSRRGRRFRGRGLNRRLRRRLRRRLWCRSRSMRRRWLRCDTGFSLGRGGRSRSRSGAAHRRLWSKLLPRLICRHIGSAANPLTKARERSDKKHTDGRAREGFHSRSITWLSEEEGTMDALKQRVEKVGWRSSGSTAEKGRKWPSSSGSRWIRSRGRRP